MNKIKQLAKLFSRYNPKIYHPTSWIPSSGYIYFISSAPGTANTLFCKTFSIRLFPPYE